MAAYGYNVRPRAYGYGMQTQYKPLAPGRGPAPGPSMQASQYKSPMQVNPQPAPTTSQGALDQGYDPWYANLLARNQGATGNTDNKNTPAQTNPFIGLLTDEYNNEMNQARNSALAQKKQLLLGFGSQELARRLLGKDPFVNMISDNPDTSFSTLGRINFGYRQGVKQGNENMGAANLFYGGARGVLLNNLGRQKLEQVDSATKGVQGQLDAVQQALLDRLGALRAALIQAESQNWAPSGGGQ